MDRINQSLRERLIDLLEKIYAANEVGNASYASVW